MNIPNLDIGDMLLVSLGNKIIGGSGDRLPPFKFALPPPKHAVNAIQILLGTKFRNFAFKCVS